MNKNSIDIRLEKTRYKRTCCLCESTLLPEQIVVRNVVSSWCKDCWATIALTCVDDYLLSEKGIELKNRGKQVLVAIKV